jgi:hypothetical protein
VRTCGALALPRPLPGLARFSAGAVRLWTQGTLRREVQGE